MTRALLTDMDAPLGRAVGNAVEVAESMEVLAGGGPADVVELTLALAEEMLDAAGLDGVDPAQTLRDGTAMDSFRELVAAQGGDLIAAVADRRAFRDHHRAARWHDGTTSTRWRLDWRCGGSARAAPSRVSGCSHGAGLHIHRRPGEPVVAGEALFTLYTETPSGSRRRWPSWTVAGPSATRRLHSGR